MPDTRGDGNRPSMPDEVWSKLVWLLVLLPGFLSFFLASSISDTSVEDEFSVTFYSLILSFIVLALAAIVHAILVSVSRVRDSRTILVVAQLVISVVVGIALGYAIENDWLYRVLRSAPLTQSLNKRSDSRPLAFLLAQNTKGRLREEGDARPAEMKQTEAWILITLSNGQKYEGWPEFYEIGDDPSEIYLSPACRYEMDQGAERMIPIHGPGVVVLEKEIVSVTFLDRKASPCFEHWLD